MTSASLVTLVHGNKRTPLLEFGNVLLPTPEVALPPKRTEEAIGWLGRQMKKLKQYDATRVSAVINRIEIFQNQGFVSPPLKVFGGFFLLYATGLYLSSKPLIPVILAGMWGTAWAVSVIIHRFIFPPILDEYQLQAQEEKNEAELYQRDQRREAQQIIQRGMQQIDAILSTYVDLRDIPILIPSLDIKNVFKNSLACPVAMGKNDLAPFLSLRIRSKSSFEEPPSFITLRPLINLSTTQASFIKEWALYEEKEEANSPWVVAKEQDPFVILEQLVTNTHPLFELDFPKILSPSSVPVE